MTDPQIESIESITSNKKNSEVKISEEKSLPISQVKKEEVKENDSKKKSREINNDEPPIIVNKEQISRPHTPIRRSGIASPNFNKQEEKKNSISSRLKTFISKKTKSGTKIDNEERAQQYINLLNALASEYKFLKIPETRDPEVLKRYYDHFTATIIKKKGKVTKWKVFLVLILLGIEWLGSKIFGDVGAGFMQQQISCLACYNNTLNQLGEKHGLLDMVENWPPEIKLGLIILINYVIFILVKKICNNPNSDKIATKVQTMIYSLGDDTEQNNGGFGGIGDLLGSLGGLFTGSQAPVNNTEKDLPTFKKRAPTS